VVTRPWIPTDPVLLRRLPSMHCFPKRTLTSIRKILTKLLLLLPALQQPFLIRCRQRSLRICRQRAAEVIPPPLVTRRRSGR